MTISTNIHLLRPVLTIQGYIQVYPVLAVRIFHFQDGGDGTNPVGLSPCILPRKCKSGANAPVPSQKLVPKVRKSRAIPPYVPGVNPPGWPLISAFKFTMTDVLSLSHTAPTRFLGLSTIIKSNRLNNLPEILKRILNITKISMYFNKCCKCCKCFLILF